MSNRWERAPLEEAVFLQEGPGIRKYEYQKGGYPIINVRGVQDGYIDLSTCVAANVELATGKWKHFQVNEGDILFTISGSIGRTAIVKKEHLPLLMNTSVVRFRSQTGKLRDDFFYYYLQSESFLSRLHAQASGTAQKNVGPTHLKTLDVPLPPLPEQQRIVGILDEAFDGIATAKANAEQNLQNARALFESHLQSVFNQRGEGWVEKQLGEIAEVQSGGTPSVSQKKYWGGDIPWYSSGELNETYTTHPERKITEDGLNSSNAKLFPKGSLLVGMYDTAALKMSILDRDGAFNQAIAGVKPNDRIEAEFILHAINANKPRLLLERRGTRQKNLSLGKIKEISIPLPKPSVQRAVVSHIRSIMAETQRLESLYQRKLAALDELKKSLLHQAFSGAL